jgi:RES domain-containing protein
VRRRRPAPPPSRPAAAGTDDSTLPSLIELDRFSAGSLHKWSAAAKKLDTLHRALYFGLESFRQRDGKRLQDAVRSATIGPYEFTGWSRVIDYRYSLEPLSVAGSVKSDGGRFNIGGKLDPGTFTAFPALYVAEDYPTALRERFGVNRASLTAEEFALRTPASFTQVRLRGQLDNLVDVSDLEALKSLVGIIRDFPMPRSVIKAARDLSLRQSPWMIRSPVTLQKQLLHRLWRMLPTQFGLPANSQIFGRMVSGAGIHGILYPSVRTSPQKCLALFPQNWSGSGSVVEVMDATPATARLTRIDGFTHQLT